MDLTHAMCPNAVGDIHFGGIIPTGLDRVIELFTSPRFFRLHVARKILRNLPQTERKITFQLGTDPRVWQISVVDWKTDPPVATVTPWRGGG